VAITVSELTNQIKRHLEPSFKGITVSGEISNFKAQQSGHYYFTLKDETSQIAVSFFNAARYKLPRMPKDGDKVLLIGDIGVYAPRGNYQFVAQGLKFTGLGDLLLKLHELKLEIQSLGWFQKETKKPLPKNPKRIGVITSPTGAVIQDIIHVLSRRCSNFNLILYPVKVQGEGAKEEIAQAIHDMNRYQLCDVMIVGRGGGSIEDLWAFNEKSVAEAIFLSSIPIISAVGHETDFTIADFVADVRAPTPSSAAEMVLEKTSDLLEKFQSLQKRFDQVAHHALHKKQMGLNQLKKHPFIRGIGLLNPFHQQIDHMADSLDSAIKSLLFDQQRQIQILSSRLRALDPRKILMDQKKRLEHFKVLILAKTQQRIHHQKQTVEILKARLKTHDPSKILKQYQERLLRIHDHITSLNPTTILTKGYCIPFDKRSNKVILSVDEIAVGDAVEFIFHNGTIGAHVDGIRSSLQTT
jgi:exodeoxyribonuclease VII large subunit